jgi:hypothetical protein
MNTSIIREAIGLLNSMVLCGEKHSAESEAIVKSALNELNKPHGTLRHEVGNLRIGESAHSGRITFGPEVHKPRGSN